MLKPLWRLRHQNLSILEIFRKQLRRQSSLKGKYNWWKKHLPIVLQSHQLAFTWPLVEVGTLNVFGPDFASFFTEMNKPHQEPFVRLWREDRSRTASKLFMMMSKENLVQSLSVRLKLWHMCTLEVPGKLINLPSHAQTPSKVRCAIKNEICNGVWNECCPFSFLDDPAR